MSATVGSISQRRLIGFAALAVVAIAVLLEFSFRVMPDSRLLVWGLLAVIAVVTAFPERVPAIVRDWSPFVAVLLLYDLLRGYADGLLFPAHTLPQIDADKWLGGGSVPTVWLQQQLWHGGDDLRWWDYATWFVYLTHFFATLIVAISLWVWARPRFAPYAAMVCTLAVMAYVTYVLFPAVPPWMAGAEHVIGTNVRTVEVVWDHVPLVSETSVFESGTHYANNVAAMPSLHAGFAFLITLYLWALVPRWWRIPLALYPVAMAFALVYSGEHYVIDCIAGWVYALLAFLLVRAVMRRMSRPVLPQPDLA